jgi:hypothetical protein
MMEKIYLPTDLRPLFGMQITSLGNQSHGRLLVQSILEYAFALLALFSMSADPLRFLRTGIYCW